MAAGSVAVTLATHFGVIGGPGFREGLVTSERPLSLDPLVGTADQGAGDVGHLLYRSLLRLDAEAYPEADLATGFTVSSNGLTYNLPLEQGLHWSDGRALTAADVVATISLAQSPGDPNTLLGSGLDHVIARALGSEVQLTLPQPRASLPALLTQLPILPLGELSATQLARLTTNPTTPLATSGPYRVSSSSPTDLLLAGNPYAVQQPRMASFDMRLYANFSAAATAFADGQVDGLLATTPAERAQLLAVHGAHAADIATFRFVDLLFNEHTPGLDDPVVRHAFATVLDRVALLHGALERHGGVLQVDAMPEGIPWIATRDPSESASVRTAATALQAGGWQASGGLLSKNGIDLSFTLTVPETPPLPAIGRETVAQLAPLGIALHLQLVPAGTLLKDQLATGRFEIAIADWNAGPDPDVSAFWRSNATPPHGFDVSGGPIDPFLDQALDRLATLTDRSARVAAGHDVDALISQDAPAVFLYAPEVSYVFRIPMRSDGVPAVGGGAARFDDIASWQTG